MNQIIRTSLNEKRKSYGVNISLAIIGIYLGILFWYMIANYLQQPASSGLVLAVCVLTVGNALLGLYQIPDQLCTNKNVENLLYLPIKLERIVFLVLWQLFKLQFLLCLFMTIPSLCFYHDIWFSLFLTLLLCAFIFLILNFFVFIIVVLLSSVTEKLSGYMFTALQYGGFLLIVWLGVLLVFKFLLHPALLYEIYNYVLERYVYFALTCLGVLILTAFIVKVLSHRQYVKCYYNLKTFSKPIHKYRNLKLYMKNPYILNELCRITRNKELLFYSNMKNIITVYLFGNVLINCLEELGMKLEYMSIVFIMMSSCAINTISSTAYSSDKNIEYYRLLPMDWKKVFLSKVIIGFCVNEIVVMVIWAISGIKGDFSVLLYLYLLAYGTCTNFICSFIGVFFDCKMPRTANNTNALLYGNISKVLVLVIMIALSISELYFLNKIMYLDYLQGMLVMNKIIAIFMLAIFFLRKKV